MSIKIMFATTVALSLAGIHAANAATKHKRHARAYAPVVSAPVAAYPAYPRAWETPRPPWAAPQECFTDEGYGRYMPCSAGKE